MKKVHIFWYAFFSEDGKTVSTGGVQTYLINLTKVFNELGYEVHFYRPGQNNIECEHYNIKMHGYKCNIKSKDLRKKIKATFKHYKNRINKDNDIVLFAEDHLSCKAKGYHVIGLQHGIYWDKPIEKAINNSCFFIKTLVKKCLDTAVRLKYSTHFDILVCVDYNYINWYRALLPCAKTKLSAIPNFAPLYPHATKPNDRINIVFARRFVPFRGTRVFCDAIKKILSEYTNVYVTLAGWGEDEKWLREQLNIYEKNVEFITYKSEDSFRVHSNKHIAVVPTVGSEGTSLSLLEAMSSHCAVIGSDVGGITNIILDGYNGLMVPAGDKIRLYEAIKYLIDNPSARERIACAGYETVSKAFSFDVWKSKWIRVINEFTN